MTAGLTSRRIRLLAGLLTVALAQLAASIAVAQQLHLLFRLQNLVPIALLALAAFVLEILQRRMGEAIGLAYTAEVRDRLFRHLLSVDPAIVRSRRHGAMMQSFVGDLTALRQWVSEGVMRAVLAVLALVGLLAWLAYAAPQLAGAVSAVTAAAVLTGAALVPSLHQSVRRVRRARGRVAALASDRLSASAAVLASGRIASEAARLKKRVDWLNAAGLRRAWITGTLRALPHLAMTIMLIAVVLADSGQSPGSLAGLMLVIGLIGHALRDLARAAELAVPGRVSNQRLRRLLALAPLPQGEARPWQRGEKHCLVADAVRLDRDAEPFSARMAQGDRVLVEGDPALRHALFAALGGIAGLAAGRLRWNGISLAGIAPGRRRRLIGWASPDLPLVAGSMLLNLRYRAPSASEEDIAALLAAWNIDPEATAVAPARLTLLRAMLGKPPVLLLELTDHALDGDDVTRLAGQIFTWPGVVLMTTGHATLRELATHRLVLHRAGSDLVRTAGEPALRLIASPAAAK